MTYQEKDLQYVLHTYKRNPICFERGKGAVLYAGDADYIDFMAGIAVCSVGHGNAKLAEALYDQALKLIHVSNLYGIPNQAELAERIVRLSGLDARVFFATRAQRRTKRRLRLRARMARRRNDSRLSPCANRSTGAQSPRSRRQGRRRCTRISRPIRTDSCMPTTSRMCSKDAQGTRDSADGR